MQIIRVENLEQAVRYARQCQDEGEFDLFRGQVERWPMVPTLLRLPDSGRDEAEQRLDRFFRWIEGSPDVAAMLPTLQSRYAVAQHYGLPTSLLDVTSEPRIAGHFASHTDRAPASGTESCIYCFHSERIRDKASEMYRKAVEDGFAEDDIDLPFHFALDVSNLWRLQAQFGSFVVAPDWLANEPELRVLEHVFEATALVFPYTGPFVALDQRLVYPDRKSALEIRLDEWFAQEDVAEYQRAARAAGHLVVDAQGAESMLREMDLEALGFKPEVVELMKLRTGGTSDSIFDPSMEVGPEPSWLDEAIIGPWMEEVEERFHDTYTEEQRLLVTDADAALDVLESSCIEQVQLTLSSDPTARLRTVRWRIVDRDGRDVPSPDDGEGNPSDPERPKAGDWLALAWDGMRALPFDDEEVAIALGRLAAALAWEARGREGWTPEDAMYLDLVLPMHFDPVVVLPEAAFAWALRHDLKLLLDERWQHLADDPRQLLLAVENPRLLFNFERWRRVFAIYLIPIQLLMNARYGATTAVYNPALPIAVRRH
jgi:FRG domain